jgi:CheY-like chemotaxis protein
MNDPVKSSERTLNILLIDDDDMDAKLLERAFRKAKIGNTIVRAMDGIEALEMLKGINGKTKPPSPRILLVDLNMPRMNGIELVQALRDDEELHRSIVFILTTSKRDEDKMAAYDLHVAGYIAKASAEEDILNLVSLMDSYGRIVEVP